MTSMRCNENKNIWHSGSVSSEMFYPSSSTEVKNRHRLWESFHLTGWDKLPMFFLIANKDITPHHLSLPSYTIMMTRPHYKEPNQPVLVGCPRSSSIFSLEDNNFSLAAFGHHSSIRKRCFLKKRGSRFWKDLQEFSFLPGKFHSAWQNFDKTSKKPIFNGRNGDFWVRGSFAKWPFRIKHSDFESNLLCYYVLFTLM